MTEETITFTSWAQFRKGAYCIAKGIALLGVAVWRAIDGVVRRWPWICIIGVAALATALAMGCIGQARAERDTLTKRNYELEQRMRRMQTALGIDGSDDATGTPKEVAGR